MLDKMQHIFLTGNFQQAMRKLPNQSVHFIWCDLYYNTNLSALWNEVTRVLIPGGVVIILGAAWNSHDIINSHREWYRFKYYWSRPAGMVEIMLFGPEEPRFRRNTNEPLYKLDSHRSSDSSRYEVITGIDETPEGEAYEKNEIPWSLTKRFIHTFSPAEGTTLDVQLRSVNVSAAASVASIRTHFSVCPEPLERQRIMEHAYNWSKILTSMTEFYLH